MLVLRSIYPNISQDQARECIETTALKLGISKDVVCHNIKINSKIFIIGPIQAIELYSEKYNKHIYLFGERHDLSGECDDLEVPEFLVEDLF